jgi:predicted O-methyltransferase YrrM
LSIAPGGLKLQFAVRGYEALQPGLRVCIEAACVPFPFQTHLTHLGHPDPGDRRHVLEARLESAAGAVVGRATTVFDTLASGVVYTRSRPSTPSTAPPQHGGWMSDEHPHVDLAALHAPPAALAGAVRRYAHLVHDTHYEKHEPRCRGGAPEEADEADVADEADEAEGGGGSAGSEGAECSDLSGPAYHARDLAAAAGVEPYLLLAHLAGQLRGAAIVDLGTHYGVSALALAGAHASNTVLSYDVRERERVIAAYNNLSVAQLRAAAPNVHFRRRNALRDLATLAAAPLISLDTAHMPDSVPFERELVLALEGVGYRGVVVCDDIHFNSEMVRWWHGVRQRKFDVTNVGHGKSGTGIIDFSGKLRVSHGKVHVHHEHDYSHAGGGET